MFLLSIPKGPITPFHNFSLTPRLEFTSCPPIKFNDFGTEFTSILSVSLNYLCSLTSTGCYMDAMNSFNYPRTLRSNLPKQGNLSFNPRNLPANLDCIWVVSGGFAPEDLHAVTAAGESIIATPPGTLPLVPTSLSSLFWRKII